MVDGSGRINMGKENYFYGPTSSPYITHAAFTVIKEGKPHLAVVEVRNEQGGFGQGVAVRDFGATISLDCLVVGYNFNGAVPLLLVSGKLFHMQLSPKPRGR